MDPLGLLSVRLSAGCMNRRVRSHGYWHGDFGGEEQSVRWSGSVVGVLAGVLLIAAWINRAAGPAVIITLSAVALLWSFFHAPVACGVGSFLSGPVALVPGVAV